MRTTAKLRSPPERLTISTCIGCGAMSLPGRCAGGCGPERKLELVAGSELDEVVDSEQQAERRARALADVLRQFLAASSGDPPKNDLLARARAALHAHEHDCPAAVAALAAEPEPVVSWWCERCGGVDAPAPCLGVCIHRPAQWARLDALQRRRQATADRLEDEQRLARAVRTLALTRPRAGSEQRHWQALREMADRAITAPPHKRRVRVPTSC